MSGLGDAINPQHYRVVVDGVEVQCIDLVELLDLGFHLGNALKYAWRIGLKHNRVVEELDKCQWYLDRWRGYDRGEGYARKFAHVQIAKDALHLELAGHLRNMVEQVRRSAYLEDGVDAAAWMRDLIKSLGVGGALVAQVQLKRPG